MKHSRAGVTTIEFALCASLLVLLLSGTISIGILTWTQSMLQSIAVQTARCLAISGTACTTGGASYAVSQANARLFSGVITTANVTVTTTCNGATGPYEKVVINSTYWSTGLLNPVFDGVQLSAAACYPT